MGVLRCVQISGQRPLKRCTLQAGLLPSMVAALASTAALCAIPPTCVIEHILRLLPAGQARLCCSRLQRRLVHSRPAEEGGIVNTCTSAMQQGHVRLQGFGKQHAQLMPPCMWVPPHLHRRPPLAQLRQPLPILGDSLNVFVDVCKPKIRQADLCADSLRAPAGSGTAGDERISRATPPSLQYASQLPAAAYCAHPPVQQRRLVQPGEPPACQQGLAGRWNRPAAALPATPFLARAAALWTVGAGQGTRDVCKICYMRMLQRHRYSSLTPCSATRLQHTKHTSSSPHLQSPHLQGTAA